MTALAPAVAWYEALAEQAAADAEREAAVEAHFAGEHFGKDR